MKLAKSHKIILSITAVVISVMMVLCSLSLFNAKTASSTVTSPSASSYFSGATMAIDKNGAKFTVESDATVKFTNKLAIDDLAITFGAIDKIASLDLTLTYDSFYVNGNKNKDDKFDKQIKNTFTIASADLETVKISVASNAVAVKNKLDVEIPNVSSGHSAEYFKIRKVDKAVASIELKVKLVDNETSGSFIITNIDQAGSVTDSKYNQSLKTVDGSLTAAYPVVSIDADMFVRNELGVYSPVAYAGEDYSLSYTVYSVLGNVRASDLYPTVDAGAKINIPTNNKKENKDTIHFMTSDTDRTEVFNVSYKDGETEVDCETYTVNTVKKLEKTDAGNNAPKYNLTDSLALEAFKAELKKQYMVENPAEGESEYVPLGTDLEIPSLEDLVIDDRTPYDKLTKTLYYVSSSESNSSTLEIPLETVGEYYFYVVFADMEDKTMEKDKDFIKRDKDGEFEYDASGNIQFGDYKDFIFRFNIEEDAKIVIETPSSQGKGYKGTKYTASKFDIKAANCDITYTLWYTDKENPTEEDWIEIKQLKDVDEEYNENGYDYARLEKINYNGQYTFTPDAEGYYKITCNVASKMSYRTASASDIIEIKEEVKVVTPASTWFADNVWSVVFLSVGTLCLVGILVLLFVKPKEKPADEEEN